MAVPLLLVLIWAAVLVPPAVRAEYRRRAAFQISFDREVASQGVPGTMAPSRGREPPVTRAQRRRQILVGLLVAMAATLVVGLLPPMRVLLVVHLFLVDSFLAYVALLVHLRRREHAGPVLAGPTVPPVRAPMTARVGPTMGAAVRRTGMGDLSPLAGAWRD